MPAARKSDLPSTRGFLLCLALLAVAGCSGGGGSDPFTSGAFSVKNVTFNSGETESAFDANTRTYTFRSFSIAGSGPRATIDATGVQRVLVNGAERPVTADQPFPVDNLVPGARVDIDLQGAGGAAATYTFKIVPDDLPDYTASAFQPTPGRVLITTLPLLNPQQRSFLLLMNESGRLLGFRSSDLPVADFQIQRTASGVERFTYCAFDRLIFTVKHSTATCHILDQGLRRIADVNARKSAGNPDGVTGHHEVVLIEDNHYLLTAYVTKLVSNIPASLQAGNPGPRTVVTSMIQEVKDGAVVFEWDGARYPEFYVNAVFDNDFASLDGLPEYLHLNAIAIDSDANLIASFRHTSQILKIHRTTGEILWRLGGRSSDFPLTAAQVFSAQHHVRRLPDGTLTLFDNGNQNTPPVSRALRFRLDESRKVVTDFRALAYQGILRARDGLGPVPRGRPSLRGMGVSRQSSRRGRDGTRRHDRAGHLQPEIHRPRPVFLPGAEVPELTRP